MGDLSDPVVIGKIGAPHGVRGTVRVRPSGSGRHLREGMEPLVGDSRVRILRSRETPKGFLIDLEGVESRPEAISLRGIELLLDRSELDAPDEDEFYAGDLVGLSVFDESGEVLGSVAETFGTPAHEVLVVRGDKEDSVSGDLYVPFTLEHVPEVDIEKGRLVVHPPEPE